LLPLPPDPKNQYQYNGKELNQDFGLDWNDYGARWYDASIGRWGTVDPLADNPENLPWSPYAYVWNNPVLLIDPDGMKVETIYKNKNTGETVEVNDGVDKTIEVGDADFEKAKDFANRIDPKSLDVMSNREYLEFFNETNSYDGWSLANIWDYFTNYPNLRTEFVDTGYPPLPGMPGKKAAAKMGTTVLGKYPDYINLAGELGAKRFNIPANIWNKMTPAEQWAANVKFLDRMIARGDKIVLSNRVTDINKVSGAFRKELDYLTGKGYRLSSDGMQMIK
jgi:RHS repeat-associated protein